MSFMLPNQTSSVKALKKINILTQTSGLAVPAFRCTIKQATCRPNGTKPYWPAFYCYRRRRQTSERITSLALYTLCLGGLVIDAKYVHNFPRTFVVRAPGSSAKVAWRAGCLSAHTAGGASKILLYEDAHYKFAFSTTTICEWHFCF